MQPVLPVSLIALIPLAVGLFIALLGGIFIVLGIRSRQRAEAALEWPSAGGRVLSAEIRERTQNSEDMGPRRSYEPVIEYEYSLMGSPMRGNRISFGVNRFGARRKAEAVVEQYAPGSIVTVYYNPQDPTQSVLEREASGSMIFVIMGAVFLVIGLGFACLMGGVMSYLSSFAR